MLVLFLGITGRERSNISVYFIIHIHGSLYGCRFFDERPLKADSHV